ncbi:hypothetical protein ACH4E8_22890 [Streptomyces sp. NPDC017979]|uniref:hypothetical protein n=1 Tax=Streptomyces sp. NPDC017979 TaxID=3365024 RepID=UPI0037A4B1C1
MARQPARRTNNHPPGMEEVEIRLIARDGVTQALAGQIAAAIPNCPTPRIYRSRKTPGQTLAYIRAQIPTSSIPRTLNAPESSC